MNKPRSLRDKKNLQEQKLYNDSLFSYQPIDRTQESEDNFEETSNSSLNKPDEKIPKKIREKSFKLKILDGDFFKTNFLSPIIVTIICTTLIAFIAFLWNMSTNIALNEDNINDLTSKVNEISLKTNKSEYEINTIISKFDVFKAEINKDIFYIREIVGAKK